jgi:hypothetical protein
MQSPRLAVLLMGVTSTCRHKRQYPISSTNEADRSGPVITRPDPLIAILEQSKSQANQLLQNR